MTILVENRKVDAVIVDNEQMTANALSEMLTKHGIVTEWLPDHASAIDFIRQHRPKVAVIHLRMMPGNGIGLSKHLRADEDTSNVQILLMSGADQEDIVKAVSEIKSDGKPAQVIGMQKPIRIGELTAIVESLINTSTVRT